MNVFGDGFIAKNLKQIKIPKKYIIYAAGVSNSNLKNKKEYQREILTFLKFKKKIKNKIFIFISSLTVENKNLKDDLYIKNKLKIENIIEKEIKNYLIIRLPQVVGLNSNKKTLTNFIFNKITNEKSFLLWKNSKRNIIDIKDVCDIIEKYLNNKPSINTKINIYNPKFISVEKLLNIFSKILNKKIKFKIIKKNNKNIKLHKLNKKFSLSKNYYANIQKKNYFLKIIKKYYK